MVKVKQTGNYDKALENTVFENPDLDKEIEKRIIWFKKNPEDTRLDSHPLTKPMTGKWAFSITNGIRIIYKWTSKTTVRFLDIGHHTKVYAKKRAKKQSPKR
ncbi:hypothetical protein HYZ05_00490 [Candidatus Daviesbacteria bacterium]|nr:hypothetical protein [Candidatus Daviesbacteria bacterium]